MLHFEEQEDKELEQRAQEITMAEQPPIDSAFNYMPTILQWYSAHVLRKEGTYRPEAIDELTTVVREVGEMFHEELGTVEETRSRVQQWLAENQQEAVVIEQQVEQEVGDEKPAHNPDSMRLFYANTFEMREDYFKGPFEDKWGGVITLGELKRQPIRYIYALLGGMDSVLSEIKAEFSIRTEDSVKGRLKDFLAPGDPDSRDRRIQAVEKSQSSIFYLKNKYGELLKDARVLEQERFRLNNIQQGQGNYSADYYADEITASIQRIEEQEKKIYERSRELLKEWDTLDLRGFKYMPVLSTKPNLITKIKG